MTKVMSLSNGTKDFLGLPEDLVEKVRSGAPLWEEVKVNEEEEDDQDEIDESKKKHEISDEEKMMRKCFGEGMFHIIPSFFRMLIFLRKMNRDFAVAFRSYGTDMKEIIWEFNKFCEGQHPCFNGRNGAPLVLFNGT